MSDSASSTPEASFRPGAAADWPSVAPIVNAAPGGLGAIDQAMWNRWAADADARLIAMTDSDRLLGFARLSELGPAEWWLDGPRFHPDHTDDDLGRALFSHVLEVFSQIGIGLLRFAASSANEALTRIASDFGFRRIISYRPLEGAATPADYRSFKLLQAPNLEIAHQYLRRSPMNRVSHFAEKDGAFFYVTQERLHQYLSDPLVQVLGWRQFDQLHGLTVIHLPADGGVAKPMHVGYLDSADDTTFLAMLAAARGIAAKRGFSKIQWMMPLSIGLDRSVATTDLRPSWDGELWLFERPLRL